MLLASSVWTLVHCIVKYSRPPDLKSSSNVSLDYRFIVKNLYQILFTPWKIYLHCFNALSHQSVRTSIHQCILGALFLRFYYQGTQVFSSAIFKVKTQDKCSQNKTVESQSDPFLMKICLKLSHTIEYQVTVSYIKVHCEKNQSNSNMVSRI